MHSCSLHIDANATRGQQAEIGRRTLQTMVLYMSTVTEMYSAVQSCLGDETSSSTQSHWDTAAAYYVGFMEGALPGAGSSLYSLGSEMCPYFEDTCLLSGNFSIVDSELICYLTLGQDAIDASDCEELEKLVEEEISYL